MNAGARSVCWLLPLEAAGPLVDWKAGLAWWCPIDNPDAVASRPTCLGRRRARLSARLRGTKPGHPEAAATAAHLMDLLMEVTSRGSRQERHRG
jgi:hypothetical protein